MIKFFIIIIFNIFVINNIHASDSIFESEFFNVDINSDEIATAKAKEIERIKILSLEQIMNQILTKKNLKLFKRNLNNKIEINELIKNIIIEDEFISQDKYSANIKVNFDTDSIIFFLRNYKINYSDLESPNILMIFSEKKSFDERGLVKSNSLYLEINEKKNGLINLVYPDLSTNDRYIIPYKKIITKNKISFKKISDKYKTPYIFILNLDNNSIKKSYNLSIYSSNENNFQYIDNFSLDNNEFDQYDILKYLSDWWKSNNIINNSDLSSILCSIVSSNIYELKFINSKINKISQVKSLILKKISLGKNHYNLLYYGQMSNLYSKLLNSKINLENNINNECVLSLYN